MKIEWFVNSDTEEPSFKLVAENQSEGMALEALRAWSDAHKDAKLEIADGCIDFDFGLDTGPFSQPASAMHFTFEEQSPNTTEGGK